MTYRDCEGTYVCQLNKPQNRAILEGYATRCIKGPVEFSNMYLDVINMVKHTAAWGKPGTNKMLNKLTNHVTATLHNAKSGKSSAFRQAKDLLKTVDWYINTPAIPKYEPPCKLVPLLTETEINELLALRA